MVIFLNNRILNSSFPSHFIAPLEDILTIAPTTVPETSHLLSVEKKTPVRRKTLGRPLTPTIPRRKKSQLDWGDRLPRGDYMDNLGNKKEIRWKIRSKSL